MEKNLLNTSPEPEVNVVDSEFAEMAEMVLNKVLNDFLKEQLLKRDRPIIRESKQGRIPTINRGINEYFLILLYISNLLLRKRSLNIIKVMRIKEAVWLLFISILLI